MNAPLRRRHAALVTTLALALPVAFAAAIAKREAAPVQLELPLEAQRASAVEALAPGAGTELTLETSSGQRWRARHDATRIAIAQVAGAELPDLLAYWSARNGGDELAPDAVLLGPVNGGSSERTYARPGAGGVLVLFSLAHGEVVAQTNVETR